MTVLTMLGKRPAHLTHRRRRLRAASVLTIAGHQQAVRVRTYRRLEEYAREAPLLAFQGWSVLQVAPRRPRPGGRSVGLRVTYMRVRTGAPAIEGLGLALAATPAPNGHPAGTFVPQHKPPAVAQTGTRERVGSIVRAVLGLVAFGIVGWIAARATPMWVLPSPLPDVPAEVRAQAVNLLGAATWEYERGELSEAIRLAQESLRTWPGYADATHFLLDVAPQATATASVRERGT